MSETESAMQIFDKFKHLGLFHNSFPVFHEPDVVDIQLYIRGTNVTH